MKFIVGVMLTSFGIFWGAEGAGAHWPGADTALLALVPAVGGVRVGARSRSPPNPGRVWVHRAGQSRRRAFVTRLRAFLRF